MADGYNSSDVNWSDYYGSLGAMPEQRGGMLVQQVPSLPQALETRSVQTYPVNASNWDNPAGVAPKSSGTQYYPSDGSYGYNSSTGNYELRQPGNAYTVGPYKPNQDFGSNAAVAAIAKAAPYKYVGQNHPALTLPKSPLPSATKGGLSFNDKFGNAYRTAALRQQVGLEPSKPAAKAAAKPAAKSGGIFGAMMGGHPLTGLASIFGPASLSRAPAVAAFQQQGMSPSQAYAAANASAKATAQATANASGGGYTPSSSGQSNDYFSVAREGSSSGGGIEGNGGITGYY